MSLICNSSKFLLTFQLQCYSCKNIIPLRIFSIFTARKRSCEAWKGGVAEGHAWHGGVHGKGACMVGAVCGRGACVVLGGVHGGGGGMHG